MTLEEYRRELGRRARRYYAGYRAASRRRSESVASARAGGGYSRGAGQPRIPAVSGQEANYWCGRFLEARGALRLLRGAYLAPRRFSR